LHRETLRRELNRRHQEFQRAQDPRLSSDIFIAYAVLAFALSNTSMFEKLAILSNVADSASDGVGVTERTISIDVIVYMSRIRRQI
jgi:hypothetical protein